jgi:uncharacterized protein
MDLNQPLSEAELDELTDFLDSDLVPVDAMDICMLHGYLTAIAIGPVTLLPSQWYARIWGQVEELDFDSLEHAQQILGLITRFYNQIVLTFMEKAENFLPALYEYVEDGKARISAEEWCTGFGLGVHLRAEAWMPLFEDERYWALLSPMIALSMKDVWDEATHGRNPVEVREQLIAILPEAVRAIHAYWSHDREERAPGLVADNFHLGGSSKTGRNAPCPCGSGKKFKKCCGGPGREA